MKTNRILRKDKVLSSPIVSPEVFSYTMRITQVIQYDGYEFSLTVMKPFYGNQEKYNLPVFLFVPSISNAPEFFISTMEMASKLVIASGQAAVVVDYKASTDSEELIFNLFAAMKWIGCQGDEIRINGNKMALVGTQLGANIAATLSLMALHDNCPKISLQILIDPLFFISRQPSAYRQLHCNSEINRIDQDWLNMQSIYDLPLDSKTSDLSGSAPTLVQLSKNTSYHCELDYYCVKLIDAGTDVTYINYDDNNEIFSPTSALQLNKTLIAHTAAELRKFS